MVRQGCGDVAGSFELGKILQRDLGDVEQRAVGQESLVTGDEHVGQGQQARKDIVVHDAVGEILEKEVAFFLVDIDGHEADLCPF